MDVGAINVLRTTIEYMLLNYQYKDAIFLAERLYDTDKTPSSGYILATCYYRCGSVQQARFLSSSYLNECPRCTLLYAKCCYALKLYQEGLIHLKGLLQCNGLTDYELLKAKFGDDVGVAFTLLGDFNRKLNFIEEASKMYQLALQYNPFLWSAFEALCQMGKATQRVEEYFSYNDNSGIGRILMNTLNNVPPSRQHATNPPPCAKKVDMSYTSVGGGGAPESFKAGLSDSSTPVTIEQFIKGGVARPPLLSFGNSKGFGSLSFSDTPTQAVLNFSIPSPQVTSTLPIKPRNISTSTVYVNAEPLEMADLITPSQQTKSNEEGGGYSSATPINNLVTPSSTYQEFSTPIEPRNVAPPSSINPRRSARLGAGGVGKSPSSMSISRHRAEVITSPLTQSRSKARLKTVKSPRIKKKIVKFEGKSQKVSPQKPRPLSPKDPQENADPRVTKLPRDNVETKNEEDKMDVTTITTANNREGTDGEEIHKSIGQVLSILVSFGTAYKLLTSYKLKDAINSLHSLPPQYTNSSWTLTHLGQAMISKENFKEAAMYYGRVHACDPHRQEGMDMFAAALWHLQRESDLSALVEDLQTSDKTRPEGLCAMSTLMNLYKEHDAAIMYLERAIQVSPDYAYAQSLLGLEYLLIKDYDKAYTAYQSAIAIDPRHFNTWFGMGHLFVKQEKWPMAEISSRKALSINPSSSVACAQLALVLQHQGKLRQALAKVDHAVSLNPANNLPKYRRALILEALERREDALKQLQDLTAALPREPMFYKDMSRILMKLNRPHEAVVCLSWGVDYAHSTRCMVGGGAIMDRGDNLAQMIETLPGIREGDFVADFMVHSDNDEGVDNY